MIRFGRDLATEAGMAGKDISVKKYVVRLSAGEREHLQALIRKGKSPAKRLLKARILLKADVSEAGEGWSDSWIIQALDTSASMIPGFWSQVQRVYANRICTSLPSSLRIAWKGVLKPRHFLGVRLAVMTMSWISSSDTWSMSIWRGNQRRNRPLAFSTPPFCHEA